MDRLQCRIGEHPLCLLSVLWLTPILPLSAMLPQRLQTLGGTVTDAVRRATYSTRSWQIGCLLPAATAPRPQPAACVGKVLTCRSVWALARRKFYCYYHYDDDDDHWSFSCGASLCSGQSQSASRVFNVLWTISVSIINRTLA